MSANNSVIRKKLAKKTGRYLFFGGKGGVGKTTMSAACCVPGMEAFDREAYKRVEKAISETKTAARIEIISAAKAYFSFGELKSAMNKAVSDYSESGSVKFPAILINGRVVSYGVPDVKTIKSALCEAGK